jgi:hypothetical protein
MAPSIIEQYIVDQKGNPTAVILPIREYKKMLSILEEVEDHREIKILSQSANSRNWSRGDWRTSKQEEPDPARKSGRHVRWIKVIHGERR